MKPRTKIIVALTLAAGIGASGVAIAQTMQHRGHGMSGGMHGNMQQDRGSMHAGMHGMKGDMHKGMHGGMHGQGGGHGAGHGSGHGSGHGQSAASGDQSASSLAFNAVNEKMHRDMAIEFSGDADVDFVRGMIPHHQGAIDMAKIVIAFGKDPEIRKLAEEIVGAQESEIAIMREWLKKRGQ
jgi:uncharacterized protein (DUF305 family)